MKILGIIFFGILGVLSRYFIESNWPKPQSFPFSTLTVNLLGCFFAGIIYQGLLQRGQTQLASIMLIGLCGGLTTFSGYALQTIVLIEKGDFISAFSYLTLSPIIGVLFIYFGQRMVVNFT